MNARDLVSPSNQPVEPEVLLRLRKLLGVEPKAAESTLTHVMRLMKSVLRGAGGAGSGNFGHAGRPGEVGGSAAWDAGGAQPTREQLDRAHKVFSAMEEGTPLATVMDRQMRGGVLKNGVFTEFTEKAKTANLAKIQKGLEELRAKDPEAYDNARRWTIAESFGVKNYDELPDVITVFRGHDEDEVLPSRVNVTSNREVAENFGADGAVTEYTIRKDDIAFSLSNSVFAEGELLVFGTKDALHVKTTTLSEAAKSRGQVNAHLDSFTSGETVTLKSGGTGVFVQRGIGTTVIVKLPDGSTHYGMSAGEFDHVS